jgi:uncharacterized protein YjbI with pentapeptide repeats
MILPQRAAVRPRIYSPVGGGAVLLKEEIARLLQHGEARAVALVGAAGAGKTTALRHLAAVFPADAPLLLLEGVHLLVSAEPQSLEGRVVVGTAASAREMAKLMALGDEGNVFRLAPWSPDDLIEYLLTARRDRCASVMRRVGRDDHALLGGNPELWAIVLDRLADDEALADARAALHAHLASLLRDTDLVCRARTACLNHLLTRPDGLDSLRGLALPGFEEALSRLLRHEPVQKMLAAERIVFDLREWGDCDFLAHRLPAALVESVGRGVRGDRRAMERLSELLRGPDWSHPMAASLMLAADPGWRPSAPTPRLTGALLAGAAWDGLDLSGARLDEADLTGARLRGANLTNANLGSAQLSGADLSGATLEGAAVAGAGLRSADLTGVRAAGASLAGANLEGARGEGAVLTGADLQGADLRGGLFLSADLRDAILLGVRVEGADFTAADLGGARLAQVDLHEAHWAGACFRAANLRGCDLEWLDLTGADFWSADLEGAYLTGTRTVGADFRAARLVDAGLAEIEWEGADLRGADLSGASFHLGSTRCGLVMSPIACEGSRTGFYTDESDELHFQQPEQIRKANLQGADLRGACVERADFYLVDLRGASYDEAQGVHFRRCRALL